MKLLSPPHGTQLRCFEKKLLKYFNEKNIFLVILLSVIIAGIFLRIKILLLNTSLWGDEVSLAYNLINKSFLGFFSSLEYHQVAPPFFMIISKFILAISGQSDNIVERDLIIRLFPFFCSVVSLPLFAYFVHKLFNNRYLTLIATNIFTFNSSIISYSVEFKQYSTEVMIAIILLIAFYLVNLKNDSYKKILLYSIIFCLAPWFSLSSFFILAGGFTVILIEFIKEKYNNKTKFLFIIITFIVNLICYYFFFLKDVLNSHFDEMYGFWTGENVFFGKNTFIWIFTNRINELIENDLVNFLLPEYIVLFILLNLLILFSQKNYKRIILILLPVVLCIIFSFASLYPFSQRLILFLIPLFVIIYSQFSHLLKRKQITLFIIVIIILNILPKYFQVSPLIFISTHYVSYMRELYFALKNENPNLNNVFISDSNGDDFKYYTNTDISEDYIIKEGNVIDYIEEKTKKGEKYWIYLPGYNDQNENIKEYFLNNTNIEVIKLYIPPKNINYNEYEYLLEFKRKNNA